MLLYTKFSLTQSQACTLRDWREMTNQSTQSKQSQIFYAASAEYIEERHRLVIVFPELDINEAPRYSVDFYCNRSIITGKIDHVLRCFDLDMCDWNDVPVHGQHEAEYSLRRDFEVSLRLATVASRLSFYVQGQFLNSVYLMCPRLAGTDVCESIMYDNQPKIVPAIRFNTDKSAASTLMHDWFFQAALARTSPQLDDGCEETRRRKLLAISRHKNRVDLFSQLDCSTSPLSLVDGSNDTGDFIDVFADWPADEKDLARHMADHMRITSQL